MADQRGWRTWWVKQRWYERNRSLRRRWRINRHMARSGAFIRYPVEGEVLEALDDGRLKIGEVDLRDVAESPDGGLIADYRGPVSDPAGLAEWFASIPGIVEHGLFPPKLVSEVFIGRGSSAERLELLRG